MTSNAALQKVKRLYGANKAGHTGSLDPLATGVLPIFFGEATKFSRFLLNADKHYLAVLQLGSRTDTGDADGELLEQSAIPTLSAATLEQILSAYRGEICQVPPMYSALKVAGQPLYKLARKGIEVERKPRRVSIHQLTLVEKTDTELVLDIRCSKGTYIRTLAEDIGADIGCGAHVKQLRRAGAGSFTEAGAIGLEALQSIQAEGGQAELDRQLLPVSAAVQDWPSAKLTQLATTWIRQGQPILVPQAPTQGWVGLFSGETFLGVGEVLDDGRIAPRRLVGYKRS